MFIMCGCFGEQMEPNTTKCMYICILTVDFVLHVWHFLVGMYMKIYVCSVPVNRPTLWVISVRTGTSTPSLSAHVQMNSPSRQNRKRAGGPGGGGEGAESDGEKSEGEGELVVDDPSPAGSASSLDRPVHVYMCVLSTMYQV